MLLGCALSVGSITGLLKGLYADYARRREARKRYEANPNDPRALEVSDFYVPEVTYGSALTTLVFFGIPLLNLVTFVVLLINWFYRLFLKYKNAGIIEW